MTSRPPQRRFDEIRLGQPLPAMEAPAPSAAAAARGLIERFVAAWAGEEAIVSGGVRVTRQIPAPQAPGKSAELVQLAGRVYGRHMDGSRCIEVEVTGKGASGPRLSGMVRVQLA